MRERGLGCGAREHAGELGQALGVSRQAVNALGQLIPRTAQVRRGERIVEEPVERLALGDVVIVRPGDRIPVDGRVESGQTRDSQWEPRTKMEVGG